MQLTVGICLSVSALSCVLCAQTARHFAQSVFSANLKHMGVDDRKQTQRFKCDTKDGDVTYCRKPPQLKAHFSSLLFV